LERRQWRRAALPFTGLPGGRQARDHPPFSRAPARANFRTSERILVCQLLYKIPER
jgi:hypothetical protein